jgi:hypothetical protein
MGPSVFGRPASSMRWGAWNQAIWTERRISSALT